MMRITANKRAPSSRGIFSPLRHAVFRPIWTASLLSNLGILVLGVGAAWTMTQISSSQRSAPYMSAPMNSISVPSRSEFAACWNAHRICALERGHTRSITAGCHTDCEPGKRPLIRIALNHRAFTLYEQRHALRQGRGRLLQRLCTSCSSPLTPLRLLLCCDLPRKVVFVETNQSNSERYRGQL